MDERRGEAFYDFLGGFLCVKSESGMMSVFRAFSFFIFFVTFCDGHVLHVVGLQHIVDNI